MEWPDYDDIELQYQQILYDVFDRVYHENQDDQHQVPVHRKVHDLQIDQDHEVFVETKVLNKNLYQYISLKSINLIHPMFYEHVKVHEDILILHVIV